MLPFSSLPVDAAGPPFNAWGLWGPDDQLGRLNLITPEAVKRGVSSVRHGLRVNLNLPLDVEPMNATRTRLKHDIIPKATCNDDALTFNTQTSTQWDGFRHYGYQDWPRPGTQTYYGGMTREEVIGKGSKGGTQNFVHHPITSRGVLLDVPRYLQAKGMPPAAPLESTDITLDILKGCVEHEGVTITEGDILIVRTGWAPAFAALSHEKQLQSRGRGIGVARGEDVLKWHWDSGVAAVASDVRAYESFPHENVGLALHEVFLGGWGMPIGELFDLEQLGRECDRLKQYTFLFTSMVLYVDGGVASPPNAQAIL